MFDFNYFEVENDNDAVKGPVTRKGGELDEVYGTWYVVCMVVFGWLLVGDW